MLIHFNSGQHKGLFDNSYLLLCFVKSAEGERARVRVLNKTDHEWNTVEVLAFKNTAIATVFTIYKTQDDFTIYESTHLKPLSFARKPG